MRDHLAIGKREVDGAAHGAEIALAFRRADRRAAELAILQRHAVFVHGVIHHADVILTNLMAKAARAAMNDGGDLIREQAERFCGARVENLRDVADFEKMVAAAERAKLRPAALAGL